MRNMVDIDVVIDADYIEPKVTIQTKEKTEQVENIIYAIEAVSGNDFPSIAAHSEEERLEILSQRDIIRAYTQGRRVMIQTENGLYYVKKSLSGLEEDLNSKRFIRISQSEIVNLHKVKCFDINTVGTIGIEFDNGTKSWASRSRVRYIKELLKE
ncbi:MAG: LytTR family transcriptional regulator [Lachnospiraceae bacterium]|nr:LytTR family transcriptional regulator [Lachnospiraceae bacterium]